MAHLGLLKRINSDLDSRAHTNQELKKNGPAVEGHFIRSFTLDQSNGRMFPDDFSKSMMNLDVKSDLLVVFCLLKRRNSSDFGS